MRRLLNLAVVTAALAVLLVAGSGPALAQPTPAESGPPVAVEPPAPKQDVERMRARAGIASAQTNSLFVPITACRLVDTRAGTGANGTKFGNGTTRSYVVRGTTGFAPQGGKSGGCGIPNSATGITATVVAITPSAGGFVQAWPAGAAVPLANVLNYGPFTMGAGTTVAIRPDTNPGLSVRNRGSTTHLVIDATGYYLPQIQGLVNPSGSIYAGSTRILSAVRNGPGSFTVKFDGNISYCTPVVNTYNAGAGIYGAAYAFSNDEASVFTWYLSSTTGQIVQSDFYFYIAVLC